MAECLNSSNISAIIRQSKLLSELPIMSTASAWQQLLQAISWIRLMLSTSHQLSIVGIIIIISSILRNIWCHHYPAILHEISEILIFQIMNHRGFTLNIFHCVMMIWHLVQNWIYLIACNCIEVGRNYRQCKNITNWRNQLVKSIIS